MNGELLSQKKKESHLSPGIKPINSIEEFHKQINEIFNNLFGDDAWFETRGNNGIFVPRFEVNENNERIEVSAELPGVEENGFTVSIVDGLLCISGEKRVESESNDKGYHFSERSYGSFQRSFVLPDGLDLEKLNAKFKNGVLKITLPKSEEKRKSVKKISIKHE